MGYISITEENIKDDKNGFGTKIVKSENNSEYNEKIFFIDNLFIKPKYIKQGIGKKLLTFTLDILKTKKVKIVYLVAEPNASKFYEKMNFDFIDYKASSTEGRDLLVYKKYLF